MNPMTATTKVRIDAITKIRGAVRPPAIREVCHASLCAAAPINQVISPARRPSTNRCCSLWFGYPSTRSDLHGRQRPHRHRSRPVRKAGRCHRRELRPWPRTRHPPFGRGRRRGDGDPQPGQRRSGRGRDPGHRPRCQAHHQEPRPVVAGERRRARRGAQRRRQTHRHPDQQRRRHAAARSRDDGRRVRAPVRKQSPRPLRVDRSPAAVTACGRQGPCHIAEQLRRPDWVASISTTSSGSSATTRHRRTRSRSRRT